MPVSFSLRSARSRWFLAALLVFALALVWPAREIRSENFILYSPAGHQMLPLETAGNAKYLPLLQVLNAAGKVGGIQEKKNALRVWFGTSQIEVRENEHKVLVDKDSYNLSQAVHASNGQWMVPVDFLTTVLPRLTHEQIEYQDGSDRVFIGDVKPVSFSVRLEPIADGARLTVQFTDKLNVRTASVNGTWVLYLGDRAVEPLEASYQFQNPYLKELRYDDQDGVPKFIVSPAATGFNFYPSEAEGGKLLLVDVRKPSATSAAATPEAGAPAPPSTNPPGPSAPAGASPGEPPAAPPSAPLPLVALDAGHGGDDGGGHSKDGMLEKNLVAQYVARVRSALLATNAYRIVLSRPGDEAVGAEQRALSSNLSGAICFLSFHAGDLGPASPHIAVFTFQPPGAAAPPGEAASNAVFVAWADVQQGHLGQSVQLAQALQQQFAAINGVQADLPISAPVRTLRSVNAPAVAIELGRLAADADATPLANPNFQQQVAGAVVQALAAFAKGGVTQ